MKSTCSDKKIVFLGGGNMAEALLKGVLNARTFTAKHITVTDVVSDRLSYLERTYSIKTTLNNTLAVEAADIVILAVKPQTMDAILADIQKVMSSKKLLISIAAGTPISKLKKHAAWKVIRVMPNTPALIGSGMSALSCGPEISKDDVTCAESIFKAVGEVIWVDETLQNAVTALSGSGPAFVFRLIDHLQKAGVAVGLTPEVSRIMTLQTFLGATKLLLETGETPDALVKKVSSPNGTTVAGLQVLDSGIVQQAMLATVQAAKNRADELSEGR